MEPVNTTVGDTERGPDPDIEQFDFPAPRPWPKVSGACVGKRDGDPHEEYLFKRNLLTAHGIDEVALVGMIFRGRLLPIQIRWLQEHLVRCGFCAQNYDRLESMLSGL